MAKTPKGELTGAELRKLIKAHNILVSIKIPKGTDREGLIKLIEDKGYKVDHKNKKIVDAKKDRPRRPKVTLKEAKEITKPKPKTALEKQKMAEDKAEKEEKKKKEERAIRKKAVEEEKKRASKSQKPKSKGVSIAVGTDPVSISSFNSPKEIKKVFISMMEEYEGFKEDLATDIFKEKEVVKKHKAELTIVRNIIKSIKADKKFTEKQLPLVKKGINFYVKDFINKDDLKKKKGIYDDPVEEAKAKIALDLQKKYK